MTELEPCVIPFPMRPSPLHESERSNVASEADAEMRATALGDLLDQIAEPEGFPLNGLQMRILAHSALGLLDEMVVLYRRALSEARGGAG